MTCPDCKGKGYIELFYSSQPCSCRNQLALAAQEAVREQRRVPGVGIKASDIVSVQPMTLSVGAIFHINGDPSDNRAENLTTVPKEQKEQKEKREPELVVKSSGSKHWYLNGKLHREDGPAIEYADGSKYWYLNGKRHREDGPAVEWANGSKSWYLNDKLHREDGPAIEYASGTKHWYLNGNLLTEEEFRHIQKPDVWSLIMRPMTLDDAQTLERKGL